MIIPRFLTCPVCHVQNRYSTWEQINQHPGWWQEMCSNVAICRFYQCFSKSFDDTEITYYHFRTQDFFFYVYDDNVGNPFAGLTHIYHNVFPKGTNVQSPFLTWKNFTPNFQELDKLNNKLKILSVFS